MNNLRRSIKAYLLVIIIFFILTFVLAALIKFTGFDEDWSKIGLIIIFAIASLLIGYLEGRIIGKRGLVVGLLSSAVFMFIVYVLLNIVVTGSFSIKNIGFILPVDLLAGAIGGVVGANSNK